MENDLSRAVAAMELRQQNQENLLGEVLATLEGNRNRGKMPIGKDDEHGAEWDEWIARWRVRYAAYKAPRVGVVSTDKEEACSAVRWKDDGFPTGLPIGP